ncbi:DUF2194 domain-containing protein [Mesoaciditoga lauensis]|uniref:DUF2194 domain-containing protein n=1 Tax=Mesoaciditoga lauensis TaxID=1495039 RepID=UPI00068C9CF2|nr:DUF2194 domain-containing protein [Mesoaciditoga lauensis]
MKVKVSVFVLAVLFVSVFFSNTLLLYKGSEQGYGNSILKRYVVPVLQENNENYKLVDVEATQVSFKGIDFVISCYYSSKMKDADKYLKKLSFFLMNGGKLFIINNIGASMNENGELVSTSELNAVYNFLGISYKGGWKSANIQNVDFDREYIHHLPIYGKRGVEFYTVFSKMVDVIESVKIDGKTYPLIMLGPRGGVSLFNFAFDSSGKAVLDFSKLISAFLIGNLSMQNRVLLIGKDENVEKALSYALIPYDISSKVNDNVQRYMAIVEINGHIPIQNALLMKYVSAGGVLMVASDGNETSNVKSAKINTSVFPLPPNFELPLYSSLKIMKPYPNSTVLVSSSQDGIPLVWSLRVGKGKIIFYPKGMLQKSLRGVFLQTLVSNVENSIQSIVNSYTVFIDDFPLPSYGIKRDMITKEFGDVTDGEFYYDIWWKDVEKIGKEMNLKYTTAFVTSYNAKNSWPYDFSSLLLTPYPLLEMKSIEKDGYEMGLHGYNHRSPIAQNWNLTNLENSYKALKAFVKIALGENYRPVSFVAPNNLIDDEGLKALKDVFPSLELVGTSYDATGTFSEYKIVNGVVVLPRTTAGYYPVNKLLKDSISSVMNFGTYQYFFHPDDLFSSDRNPSHESWDEMKESMKEFLSDMQNYYPWLENHYAYEAAKIFKIYLTQTPSYKRDKNEVEVSLPYNADIPRYFMFRSSGKLNIEGGKILYRYQKSNLYIIEMTSRVMIIKVI